MLRLLRPRLAMILASALVIASCSGSTTISATGGLADTGPEQDDTTGPDASLAVETTGDGVAEVEAAAASTTDEADAATTTTADEADTATTPPTAPTGPAGRGDADDRLPEGWIEHDIEVLSVAVPEGWTTMTNPIELEPVLAAARAAGADFGSETIRDFESWLETGEAFIAVGERGDSVSAIRQFGLASFLSEHEAWVRELELEVSGFAQNVSFTSEPRRFNGLPGVLVRGTYQIEDQRVFWYQFGTHSGTHLYWVTLTLFSGDDPGLATDLFRNFSLG